MGGVCLKLGTKQHLRKNSIFSHHSLLFYDFFLIIDKNVYEYDLFASDMFTF